MKKESIGKNFWFKQPKTNIDKTNITVQRRGIVEMLNNAKADDFYWPFVIIAFLCAYILCNWLSTQAFNETTTTLSKMFDKLQLEGVVSKKVTVRLFLIIILIIAVLVAYYAKLPQGAIFVYGVYFGLFWIIIWIGVGERN